MISSLAALAGSFLAARSRATRSIIGASVVGLAIALPTTVLGQEDPPSDARAATSISITFEPSRMEGLPHYLAARLVSEDGSAVVSELVKMRRVADAFGGRTVTIGTATTDHAGIGRVPVEPREDVYRITASFGGNDALADSESELDVVFPSELVILPEHAPQGGLVDPQLRPLADVMPLAIGAGVLLVWGVLLGLTVLTLRRIHADHRGERIVPGTDSAESPGAGPGSQD